MSTETKNNVVVNDSVVAEGPVATVSPYKAAKIVNQLLLDAGVDKVLPPQMFYNYTTARIRAGKPSFIEVTEVGDNKFEITISGLNKWFEGYLAKQTKTEV